MNTIPDLQGETRAERSDAVQTDGGELSLDTVFRVLSNRRRRFALYFLAEADDVVEREELARRIAAWESDTSIGDVPGDSVARITVALDHAHLPRLEDDGIVTYDREAREVTPTDLLSRLLPYLELARPEDFD